jgi:3-deoxy-manno-octulosonate cytidylyltransferase (CMP-KDO synthetase)
VRTVILIPARLASTRLPNKPLADIAGKPMIVRVAEAAGRARCGQGLGAVVVAADDEAIVAACQVHGINVVLTRKDHPSGSDRLAQACSLLGLSDEDVVVNVQGDEPLMDPDLIDDVAALLVRHPGAAMGTASHAIASVEDYLSPHVVKVVTDKRGQALYFSRAPIAFERDAPRDIEGRPLRLGSPAAQRHIGIYSYRVGFLRQFPTLPQAPLEQLESLEQLRALWHGHVIMVTEAAKAPGPGVDTPDDLVRVRRAFATSML